MILCDGPISDHSCLSPIVTTSTQNMLYSTGLQTLLSRLPGTNTSISHHFINCHILSLQTDLSLLIEYTVPCWAHTCPTAEGLSTNVFATSSPQTQKGCDETIADAHPYAFPPECIHPMCTHRPLPSMPCCPARSAMSPAVIARSRKQSHQALPHVTRVSVCVMCGAKVEN